MDPISERTVYAVKDQSTRCRKHRADATRLCLRQFYLLAARLRRRPRLASHACATHHSGRVCVGHSNLNCISPAARVIRSEMRLLIVEDETRIAELVKAGLARAGF